MRSFDSAAIFGAFLLLVLVVLPSGALIAYLDRKIAADFQARIGPNRAGPVGLLQPVADFLKLVQKRATREGDYKSAFWLVLRAGIIYSGVVLVPLGSSALLLDGDMSFFLPFCAVLAFTLVSLLLGTEQGSVSRWFGGVRLASLGLSGAFPALICALCAGVRAGGFRWSDFSQAQGASPLGWTAFANPFQFVAFLVFVCSGLVLLDLPPMDGGSSLFDLGGGISSGLSGARLGLFKASRFYSFFLWAQIAVILFLGGWNLPIDDQIEAAGFLGGALLLFKTIVLMVALLAFARTNPRVRVDQSSSFAWRTLSPVASVAFLGAALWEGWRGLS